MWNHLGLNMIANFIHIKRDIIKLYYRDELSLEQLASRLNVTARTLSRRFVSAIGTTPIQYLIRQRLNIAKGLLQSTDLQIQIIAEQSGFGSATVFCRQFALCNTLNRRFCVVAVFDQVSNRT